MPELLSIIVSNSCPDLDIFEKIPRNLITIIARITKMFLYTDKAKDYNQIVNKDEKILSHLKCMIRLKYTIRHTFNRQN